MDTTKSKVMLNSDPEIATPNDLKKNTSCLHSLPVKIMLLMLAALLTGMVIATVIIFTTEMHVVRVEEEHHRANSIGDRRHHQTPQNVHKGTIAPAGDQNDDDDAKLIKNWDYGFESSSSSSWDYPTTTDSTTEEYIVNPDTNTDKPDVDQEPSEAPSNPDTPEEEPSGPEQPSTPDKEYTWEELQNRCGLSSVESKIVNGVEVTDYTRWPWAVYLSSSSTTATNPASGYFCGAELISPQWAVTAAHCVADVADPTDPGLTIVFGHLDQTSQPPNTASVIAISQVISHENYNDQTINNDIALLKLSSRVTFSDNLRPVCLNEKEDEYERYEDCYVVGWGATSSGGPSSGTLQEVASRLVDNAAECVDAYSSQSPVTEQMLCAKTNHKGNSQTSGSCQGDSGGPVQCRVGTSNKFNLVGVTSWGIGCADANYPDVMTRVSQFYNWIKNKIRNQL